MDKDSLWKAVLGELEVSLSKAHFITWFKNTSIDTLMEDQVIIRVPNQFTKDWLEDKYHSEVIKAFQKKIKGIKKISYIVKAVSSTKPANLPPISINELNRSLKAPEKTPQPHVLNPHYTFETFVVGESNKLAAAAAQAVVKEKATAYNPLFIYGGVGLGKTHLMQAIGNAVLQENPRTNVLYVTSDKFIDDVVTAMRAGKTKNIKEKYRKVDYLLIDDVQFLAGKEATQEELFHTFNDLHQSGRQIILTSDKPPKAIALLEERLRSRFEWGMIADIGIPNYETRLAILQSKLQHSSLQIALPGPILEYIAKNIKNNVRELESALTRVLTFIQLNNNLPSVSEVENLLGGILITPGKKIVKASDIIRAVGSFFGLKKEDLLGRRRTKEVVIPRQILVYLLREELDLPYKKIGTELGGRDHTTIIHDYNKIQNEASVNRDLSEQIIHIKDIIYGEK